MSEREGYFFAMGILVGVLLGTIGWWLEFIVTRAMAG